MATTSTEPKQDPRDLVIALLVGMLITPFIGMLRAIVYQLLWSWFLAPQYGGGPTLRAWFGVGVLYSLISFRRSPSGEVIKNPVRLMIESTIIGALTLGTALVAAAMARAVWGWR